MSVVLEAPPIASRRKIVTADELPTVIDAGRNEEAPILQERRKTCSEQRLALGAVDWNTYQTISKALTGRHVRFTYDRGRLEFMTISSKHGRLSRLFNRLIVVLTEELNMPVLGCGDMTCDNEAALRGLEPDECFYLENEPLVRGKEEIDLATDPPPDLAIEIELSRATRDRMNIYGSLRVPEVWRFDGSQLTVHQLTVAGEYATSAESRFFPKIEVAGLLTFIERRTQMDENSLLKSFREWVRQKLSAP